MLQRFSCISLFKPPCSKLYKRKRRKFCEFFGLKNVLDSKKFWKMMRPFLSDKKFFCRLALTKITKLFFLTAIWLPHDQVWAINKGAA